jgi:hypothetical protein
VAQRRLESVTARFPFHISAHRAHLQQVCAKWGGSHEKMHDFARTAMLAAPEGSPFGELVALGVLEHWSRDPGEEGDRYILRPEVAERLSEAWARSLGRPEFRTAPNWFCWGNTFALAFSVAGRKAEALEAYRLLDGAVCESAWQYLKGGTDDPVGTYAKWQARMLR